MAKIFGSKFGELIVGGSENDVIHGFDGSDIILGGAGHDFISGDGGNDVLYGGSGNDTIRGGTGKDIMYGRGSDPYALEINTFQFALGDSGLTTDTADIIRDFTQLDRIDVPDVVVRGPHTGEVRFDVWSIEDAAALARSLDPFIGGPNNTAYLFSNPAIQTSYLVMDMNANGLYDTGVVLDGLYLTSSAHADSFLDTWLV